MKKENITKAVNRVKQAYGIEATIKDESSADIESIKHQKYTDRITKTLDFAGILAIYGYAISYGVYKATVKVPDVVDQISLVCSDIYQYIAPFIKV